MKTMATRMPTVANVLITWKQTEAWAVTTVWTSSSGISRTSFGLLWTIAQSLAASAKALRNYKR